MSTPQRKRELRAQFEREQTEREEAHREALAKQERLAANLREEIATTGLPEVLAEMLLDPKGLIERLS